MVKIRMGTLKKDQRMTYELVSNESHAMFLCFFFILIFFIKHMLWLLI